MVLLCGQLVPFEPIQCRFSNPNVSHFVTTLIYLKGWLKFIKQLVQGFIKCSVYSICFQQILCLYTHTYCLHSSTICNNNYLKLCVTARIYKLLRKSFYGDFTKFLRRFFTKLLRNFLRKFFTNFLRRFCENGLADLCSDPEGRDLGAGGGKFWIKNSAKILKFRLT